MGEFPERIKGSNEQGFKFFLLVTEFVLNFLENLERNIKNIFLVLSGVQIKDKQEVVGFTLCRARKKNMGMFIVNEPIFMKFRQNRIPCPMCVIITLYIPKSI